MQSFSVLKQVVHIVTPGLYRVKTLIYNMLLLLLEHVITLCPLGRYLYKNRMREIEHKVFQGLTKLEQL
jgi:hypothetical protein